MRAYSYRTEGSVSEVDCSVAARRRVVADERLGSLEGVDVVLVGRDDSVAVEVRNPVEDRSDSRRGDLVNVTAHAEKIGEK